MVAVAVQVPTNVGEGSELAAGVRCSGGLLLVPGGLKGRRRLTSASRSTKMPMDAPCCERAVREGQKQVCRQLLPVLRDALAAVPDMRARRDLLKRLCMVHPELIALLDTS